MAVEFLNDHKMYYEVHGEGDPVLVMGGWGTFCHGGTMALPWGLMDNFKVILFDYRGIGESTDDPALTPSMKLHAADVEALLDHLGLSNVHIIGLVGMGACVGQELAIKRPELVRSMINTGCWANVDRFLRDMLECFRTTHRDQGFLAFQQLVTVLSFEPDYYNDNIDRLLGLDGVWGDLNGRFEAHSRLVEACITHDAHDRLGQISAPSLIVHAPLDLVTSPRYTIPIEKGIPTAEGLMLEGAAHVIAGKEMKKKFAGVVMDFLGKH